MEKLTELVRQNLNVFIGIIVVLSIILLIVVGMFAMGKLQMTPATEEVKKAFYDYEGFSNPYAARPGTCASDGTPGTQPGENCWGQIGQVGCPPGLKKCSNPAEDFLGDGHLEAPVWYGAGDENAIFDSNMSGAAYPSHHGHKKAKDRHHDQVQQHAQRQQGSRAGMNKPHKYPRSKASEHLTIPEPPPNTIAKGWVSTFTNQEDLTFESVPKQSNFSPEAYINY